MKFIRKRFVVWLLLIVLAVSALGFIFLPPQGYIPVLMYHFIMPDSEIGTSSLNLGVRNFERQMWFLKTFGFQTLSLEEYDEIKAGKRKPKGREILLTFDDGHRSYSEHALPIMDRFRIHSSLFLIWNHMNDAMWKKDYLTLDEMKTDSKRKLENTFGRPFYFFCYPSGQFNEQISERVAEAGYKLAFTTAQKRLNGKPETFFSITRLKVGPRDNLLVFWLYVSGITPYVKKLDLLFHQLTGRKASGTLNVYKPSHETM
ncbi:MAG: polysaccharide deacetylase family protein [Candidatus Omnitrophica bacterium]|nr:polysaccharide deacetylase family protein [Candidatus Omnitrophota bacterium]